MGQADDARFIPAPAGNTPSDGLPRPGPTVHPRTRGEHYQILNQLPRTDGSSPHPRGTPASPLREGLRCRFIPAPAGNTRHYSRRSQPRAVHPRTRGEHAFLCMRSAENHGSSPHPRGTRASTFLHCVHEGFIPAPAGNTSRACRPLSLSMVHPRTRGEHIVDSACGGTAAGSSPHPRGTQWWANEDGWCLRFIPAPAGNTLRAYQAMLKLPVHPRTRGEHLIR